MFIVPGVAVMVGTAFSVNVMINEGAGIVASIRRSVSLIGDRFGTIFTLTVALAAIAIILQIVLVATLTALAPEGLALSAMMWSVIGLVPPTVILGYATPVSLLYCDVVSQRGELQSTRSVEVHP